MYTDTEQACPPESERAGKYNNTKPFPIGITGSDHLLQI